jgi:hypothetical protein
MDGNKTKKTLRRKKSMNRKREEQKKMGWWRSLMAWLANYLIRANKLEHLQPMKIDQNFAEKVYHRISSGDDLKGVLELMVGATGSKAVTFQQEFLKNREWVAQRIQAQQKDLEQFRVDMENAEKELLRQLEQLREDTAGGIENRENAIKEANERHQLLLEIIAQLGLKDPEEEKKDQKGSKKSAK